jgi:hypothetical protein
VFRAKGSGQERQCWWCCYWAQWGWWAPMWSHRLLSLLQSQDNSNPRLSNDVRPCHRVTNQQPEFRWLVQHGFCTTRFRLVVICHVLNNTNGTLDNNKYKARLTTLHKLVCACIILNLCDIKTSVKAQKVKSEAQKQNSHGSARFQHAKSTSVLLFLLGCSHNT